MASRNGFVARPKGVFTRDPRKPRAPPVEFDFSNVECCQKSAHVCAICEEGGDLLFCDGPCMRHFHRSRVSLGADSWNCPGLDYRLLPEGRWMWPDCNVREAMCMQCHRVGRTQGIQDEEVELRQCPDPLCLRFFCFTCLPALAPSCPVHSCDTCTKPELENPAGMVDCLRCPRAWHLACLEKRQANGYMSAKVIYSHEWRGQLHHMVYCGEHNIDPHLGTPIRSHVTHNICLPHAQGPVH